MSTEFQYGVFLSHSQADKPRVRRLAERLRAADLRVWFDEWVIQPGDAPSPVGRERVAEDWVRDRELAIERGLEASRTLVLCLSPAALGSDWVGLERSALGRGNLPFRERSYAGGGNFSLPGGRNDCHRRQHRTGWPAHSEDPCIGTRWRDRLCHCTNPNSTAHCRCQT